MDGVEHGAVAALGQAQDVGGEVGARKRVPEATKGGRYRGEAHIRRLLGHPGFQHRLEMRAVRAGVAEDFGHFDLAGQRGVRLAAVDQGVVLAFDRRGFLVGGAGQQWQQEQHQQGQTGKQFHAGSVGARAEWEMTTPVTGPAS